MTALDIWQKSSYSGGGSGNACVEIAHRTTHTAIRDSKIPAEAILTFPTGSFTTFIDALKPTADFARLDT
ncbi:DUF397 domain-containing protein [Streptomyces sp. NPDC093252]|uniref:DUF397 domain-containing protein n=1 Tax=Streptomyces sp. NPDC093252 TaxID=3154980 RepID=UPI0034300999